MISEPLLLGSSKRIPCGNPQKLQAGRDKKALVVLAVQEALRAGQSNTWCSDSALVPGVVPRASTPYRAKRLHTLNLGKKAEAGCKAKISVSIPRGEVSEVREALVGRSVLLQWSGLYYYICIDREKKGFKLTQLLLLVF